MKAKENLRESLGKPTILNLIRTIVKRRGFTGSPDTLDEIVAETAVMMLEREEYYEKEFQHGISTFVGQVITSVLARYSRKPDALNGDLVFLDVSCGSEDEDVSTFHDVLHPADDMRESNRVFTEPGMPERITYYLSQLPDAQSDVFALKAVYGHTHAEIADLLGVSVAYSKELYTDAKRELLYFRDSERAYEAQQEIGDVSGRIISNAAHMGGVWSDFFWQERHAQPGEVYQYSKAEINAYCHERGLQSLNPDWCNGCTPDNCTGCGRHQVD